jgi:hypothetical protein
MISPYFLTTWQGEICLNVPAGMEHLKIDSQKGFLQQYITLKCPGTAFKNTSSRVQVRSGALHEGNLSIRPGLIVSLEETETTRIYFAFSFEWKSLHYSTPSCKGQCIDPVQTLVCERFLFGLTLSSAQTCSRNRAEQKQPPLNMKSLTLK